MRIGVPKESRPDELRVAATPETVAKMTARGGEVVIESGAGAEAAIADTAYTKAGARMAPAAEVWSSDVVLKVQPPTPFEAERLRPGAVVVSFLWPEANREAFEALAARGVTVLAMEAVPRIARAQKMDALSSMANLAGYKAVLEAANAFGRYFPLLMTAAGTIPPAQVLVIGAGVAGLSAIVTARRLGAVVRAFDPRPPVREQVESLGARFLELPLEVGETEGGYAVSQSEEFLERERALLADHVRDVDIVVTTALIPGQPAPVLITEEMVAGMRRGSVIVDLAAERGGNCACTVPDEVVDVDGVAIIGWTNLPSRMPGQASVLYARVVWNLLADLWGDDGLRLDRDDEIASAVAVIREGTAREPLGVQRERGADTEPSVETEG
jgi:NAD(P) transhydrogenase subunit alpha